MDEFDLNDGFDNQTLNIMRVRGHMTRMIGYIQAMVYHAGDNDRHGYLWTLTNILRLVFTMANEVGADFWEVDLDSNFSIFGVRQFTEWPGPLH